MESKKEKIVVIGAGLTGLTTSYYLRKYGFEVILLEKENHTGGVIQTLHEDGFTFECGPNTGSLTTPEAAELFEDHSDNCTLETAKKEAKRRLIWKKGQWHPLPGGPIEAITTPLFKLKDKFRILFEPFRPKGKDEMESISDMIIRRLGKSFLDYAINPFVGGVYAGNPDKLIMKYALPKMYNMEERYGSLVLGGVKRSKEIKSDPFLSKATREVFSMEGGLSNLTDSLSKKIGSENIRLGCDNLIIAKKENGYQLDFEQDGQKKTLEATKVISTAGAFALPSLFPFLKEEKLKDITNLNYAKIVLVILGYKEWFGMPLNAFGGLVPAKEKKNFLGILFTSSFFRNRAPENGCVLSMFIGGRRFPKAVELTDDEIKELALTNMKNMMDTELEPDLLKIYRYEHAIPQYEASTRERLQAIADLEKEHEGLYLAGNIRNGIGMADRIKQGRDLADLIGRNQK